MFERLFSRWRSAAPSACVANGRAIYAVGDIHGRLDLLTDLLAQVAADARRHPADQHRELVFLGDYIDRGTQSRGVIDALLELAWPEFTATFLMGNHEEAMLEFLDGQADGVGWLTYGGLETLISYGIALRKLPTDAQSATELREALRAAVPPRHIDFLRGCVLSHVEGDYVFVHAGVRPGRSLEQQDRRDLLWIREEFLRAPGALPGKVVVHGHTICDAPQDLGHRIDIDTGAFVSGRLTCLVLRGVGRRFLATGSGA
ncbi:MAG TPA: metallophosphoesterase family protein [Reyranella sp.]|jgi:serine/threonine protein phosphatase 1|nr:metallophosphoesterase family protein [Reyranella sp.]